MQSMIEVNEKHYRVFIQNIIGVNEKRNRGSIQSIIGVAQGAVLVRTRLIPASATVASESVFWGQTLRICNKESGVWNLQSDIWKF